jgi:cell division protein FtsZ
VRVTVIAAGFESTDSSANKPTGRVVERPVERAPERPSDRVVVERPAFDVPSQPVREPVSFTPSRQAPGAPAARQAPDSIVLPRTDAPRPARTIVFDDSRDELDVPDFLK